MKIYHYNSASLIDRVTFEKADNGSSRVYLHARGNPTSDQCKALVDAVANEGWYAIPVYKNGSVELEVRGYLREDSVTTVLKKNLWVSGNPEVEEPKDNRSWTDRNRGKTLRGVSGFFLAADFCYSRYGFLESRPEDVAAGIAYGIGSATMGLLGTNAQAVDEIKKQTRKLIKFAKEHHLDLSNNFTIPIVTENNKRDVWHKIIDTLQTYPAEIGNSFTSLAGSLIAYSAWKYKLSADHTPHGHSKLSGYMDFGLGLSTVTSGMIAALVKEKKHDPDEPPKHGIAGMWEWIQERPLSIAAFGYMCSTLCHAGSTIKEYFDAKKSNNHKTMQAIPWRAGFIACTIIGEILLMLSSKGHGDGVKSDMSTEDSIISIAAEIIAKQKPDIQPRVIEEMTTFLGRADVLGEKDKDVGQKLINAVNVMKHNPWVCTATTKPHVSGVQWQEKIAAKNSASCTRTHSTSLK